MEHIDTIIIGAGVIGLATARALAQRGREVLILESESGIGMVTSSRNSCVIHAGLYYKPDSIRAKVCVEGRDRLYRYAAERGIPHKRCGKILVATAPEQLEKLENLRNVAAQNGVTNLVKMTPAEVHELEPEVFCLAALHSPDTGILDVHAYFLALLGDAETAGATLALQSPVLRGEVTPNGFVLEVGGAAPMRMSCTHLINAAGLGAQEIAGRLDGLDPATIPPLILGKGSYFSLVGKPPFSRLVYPMPGVGSLGIHATCDLAGRVRFGPDIEWVDHIDYTVDPTRAPLFEAAIRAYYPHLPTGMLVPDYAGVRPKIARANPYDTDFIIQTPRDHHVPGLINLYGIESPGLTSSLALGDVIADSLLLKV